MHCAVLSAILSQVIPPLHRLWPCGRKDLAPEVGTYDNSSAMIYTDIIIINIGCLVTKLCAMRTYFLTDYLN